MSSEWRIDEQQLAEVNALIHASDVTLVHNCLTRTAQQSKLFPLMPYIMLSFYESYYRWPDQLRRATAVVSPEEMGHRARNATCKLSKLTAWSGPMFYVQARSEMVKLGLIRPQDNLEDLWFVMDWWKRFVSAFRRSGAHQFTLDAWDIAQEHEERTLQVFEADAYAADERLRQAAGRLIAVATQYSFLSHCECRLGLHASGPYSLGDRRLLHTRDFLDLSECDLPWLDGIAGEIPHNNLTLAIITDDVAFEITDLSSVYATPEAYQERIIGVGLYTSDFLEDRYIPVGMDSREDLIDTLESLAAAMKEATRKLYGRFSGWSMDQMIEAGVVTYFQATVDAAHMAGTFRQHEWSSIDQRTRNVWPLYNEEYSYHGWVSDQISQDGTLGACNEYYLHPVHYREWREGGRVGPLPRSGRVAQLVPAHVLDDHDYSRRVNPSGDAGLVLTSELPAKQGGYTFHRGRLTEDEMNQAARDFDSPLLRAPWRNIDDPSVKWRYRDAEVDALYRYVQQDSRLLADRGAAVVRDDIAELRRAAGEPTWAEASAARRPVGEPA